ncbi:GxGYxYP domain-containing protein [Gorillibacterium timonense]|uniref:GxGYxYP domain-containing protein n=1 Tax=Gorillibacterium timonense TaxID=1689269 RepID=UPI00071D365F|nr:GxGYxYP domain-containing protein [Gorillibacterium timonense]
MFKRLKRKGITMVSSAILCISLLIPPSLADAAVSWPASQILPTLSAPAATLDAIGLKTSYSYSATGTQVFHETGQEQTSNRQKYWTARTSIDTPNKMLAYGPYATDIPTGYNTAYYNLLVDNNTANNQDVVVIDVRDNTTGQVLATQTLTRQMWNSANSFQRFELPYTNAVAGHSLEFRVRWLGTSLVSVSSVGTTPRSLVDLSNLFTSLKGLLAKDQPRMYTLGEEEGSYTWANSLGLGYADVTDKWSLITKYRSEISGIVVYDYNVPDTLNLAATIASVKNGIVAGPELVSMLTSAPYNLPILDDLQNQFANKLEVYHYLKTNYWPQTTKRVIVGLDPKLPGHLRDYSAAIGASVVWLDPRIPAEDTLLRQFLAEMAPGTAYMGWWPDEASGVERVSEYGLSTIAADYSTNLTVFGGTSRNVAVKSTPNKIPLDNKIYVSLIMSDGDNLQYMERHFRNLWDSPGRGSVPLGWTVSPAMLDAMPGVLNYYYNTATANDVFISGPSGIGYTYPNFWSNQTYLDSFITQSNDYMKRSGLKIATIWNFINGGINGNVGNSFANNAPSLLGLTTQQAGGSISIYNNLLPVQGLNTTYGDSADALINTISQANVGWNGQQPLFLTVQANPWQTNYQDILDTANHFASNANIVFVRTDTYFQLVREYYGLPVDPDTLVARLEAENTTYASSPFSHSVGRAGTNGWTANVAQDSPGYMLWGGYSTANPAGGLTATFRINIDSLAGNNDKVLTLDVRDNTTGQVLKSSDVYRNQFKAAGLHQDFSLAFDNPAGHEVEFRAYYHDVAAVNIDKVTVTKNIGKYEAEGTVVAHSVGRAVSDGWQANPTQDNSGHMLYGPYDSNVPVGSRAVTFRLKVDNNTADNDVVAVIDVRDANTGSTLVQSSLTRQQFTVANQYQDFTLSFEQTLGRKLEYRVYFADKATVTVDNVVIR